MEEDPQLKSPPQADARLTRYLLGELPERERERLEEEFFADDEVFEQLLIAEEELIDTYARGGLAPEVSERFEKSILASPRGRARVRFARALTAALPEERSVSPPLAKAPRRTAYSLLATVNAHRVGLSFALAAVVAALLLPWFFFDWGKKRDDSQQPAKDNSAVAQQTGGPERSGGGGGGSPSPESTPQLDPRQTPPARDPQRPSGTPSPAPRPSNGNSVPPSGSSPALIFALTPGAVRGGGDQVLTLPSAGASVRLRLNVDAVAHRSYRAVIETAGGRKVWSTGTLAPPSARGRAGTIELPALPARVLPAGDYVLLLTGKRPGGDFDDVAEYSFTVVKKLPAR